MAYQYRFVDILARGLENAANRADRAEAARVQQEQFEQTEKRASDEFDALQKIRESAERRAREAADEEKKYRKLNYELQVDRAIMDMIHFDAEQQNAMERLDKQLANAMNIAKLGDANTSEMIDVATLPPALREMLDLPEGTKQVSAKVLPVYNTAMAGMNKVSAVDPNSLTELSDENLQSLSSFNTSIMSMDPVTALTMGVKASDIATIGQSQQHINAEVSRRKKANEEVSRRKKAEAEDGAAAADTLISQFR